MAKPVTATIIARTGFASLTELHYFAQASARRTWEPELPATAMHSIISASQNVLATGARGQAEGMVPACHAESTRIATAASIALTTTITFRYAAAHARTKGTGARHAKNTMSARAGVATAAGKINVMGRGGRDIVIVSNGNATDR